MMKGIRLLCVLTIFGACDRPIQTPPNGPAFDGTAYQAVYATSEQLAKIETLPPRSLHQPGKIYILGNYLFVNELGEGVHIIDNTDPTKPQKISFVKILGNHDIAAQGNYLYADNARDLVVLDISNPTSIKLLKRVENAIPQQNYPPYQNVYFECVDEAKGLVVGWEKVEVPSPPACFR